jgi:thiol:disulfide interchange protein DsbA
MRLKKAFISGLLAMILAGLIAAADGSAEEQNSPFPSYGSGSVEVRIYSDYFCPPCRAMEPAVDPVLKDLLKKNVIRLTLVDTPFHPHTALYARHFLYALKKNNDVDHAFRVRSILIEVSTNKSITTQEQIEAIFKEKGIPYAVFDVKPVFSRYSALLTEDKINTTPTCVIIKSGQKKTFVGGPDVINALKSLQ